MADTTAIDVERIMNGVRDAVNARRVFADPIERDGVVIIPAAKIRGGAGGGAGVAEESPDGGDGHGGTSPAGSGGGAGFGVSAHPAGAFVIHGDDVVWQPAVDRQRVIMASLALAGLVILVLRPLFLRRS